MNRTGRQYAVSVLSCLTFLFFACGQTDRRSPSAQTSTTADTSSEQASSSETATSTSESVGTTTQAPHSYTSSKGSIIFVDIGPNQIVTSPLNIAGTAPGPWYFEAVFPIKVLDASGAVVAHANAEAQADAKTTAPVAFTASLTFQQPTAATGTLVLHNDNPSDLPENADEVLIPIRFH